MKFMHLADVHLGCVPDQGHPWSGMRAREIWDTFRSCIEDAARERIDLLLIAGDLFHAQPTMQELREVNYLFASLPQTRVVLIAGNHDCLQPGNPCQDFAWSPNVVWLFSTDCECVRFPEIHTEVYGFSYDRQEIPERRLDGLHPAGNDWCHILLSHGGDARHVPFDRQTLEQSGFDYIALGHIHKMEILIRDKAAFPGCLEPLECNDLGPHGYILGEVHRRHVSISFVEKARRSYREMEVVCTPEDTTFSLCERAAQAVMQNGPDDLYRVVLTGFCQPGTRYETEYLSEAGLIVSVEDRTAIFFDLEELRREYAGSIVERFIDSFPTEGDRTAIEEQALRCGLEALLGK